jgi:hypothetical protein
MSHTMKPPASEPSGPPYPHDTPSPDYTQQPKKSRRWVWIVLGIIALLCILSCTLAALGASWAIKAYTNSPLYATDMYYSAIKQQDYTKAYAYLGAHLQTVYSQQAFTQAAQQSDATNGKVSRFEMLNIPTSDPANVTLRVTRTDGTIYNVHLEFRQEGGTWKVTAFDRI